MFLLNTYTHKNNQFYALIPVNKLLLDYIVHQMNYIDQFEENENENLTETLNLTIYWMVKKSFSLRIVHLF